PYVIKEIVPGQQVIAEANPYYAFGKPKTPKMEIKAVPSAQVVAAAKSGEYDIIDSFSSDLYEKFAALKNGKIASNYYGGYGYISFKLGKWNKEKNEVVTDPNAKMADKNLRKAMAMAVDRDTVNKKLQNNLSIPLYQLIPPMFATIYDNDFEGIKYDLEGAKKVLDEAGYKDTNGDGIR
ncbi:MAG: oligopeptide ABC transporter substrate-binding protein, partial [Fusobacterium periodonticum]|nr:oligopeptide ABC transporter substrate-binding protein [Fusobacterium periodonticum]